MRILLINEYVESRGAEQIVKEQIKIFKDYGHQVKCVCFAFSPHEKKRDLIEEYSIIPIPKIGKLLFLPHVYLRLRYFLHSFSPEVILLHNIYSSPITVYKALAGYNVFQIIHDYKIVCPTSYSILLNENNIVCEGYRQNSCIQYCSHSIASLLKIKIRLALVKINEKLRKKYVRVVLTPSERLCRVLEKYGYNSYVLNNPIQVSAPLRLRKSFGVVKKILYVGGLNFEKGILPLARKIMKETTCELDLFGGYTKGAYSTQILKLANNSSGRIKYWGMVSHEELMTKFLDYDFVIVPSLWIDNYPTIILESMANSVCVIASNRGGAVDLLSNDRGILFEWESADSISFCLSEIMTMSIDKYNSIVSNAYDYVCKNNNQHSYYNNLIKRIYAI